jgi:ketosteroid isomerase-like protein
MTDSSSASQGSALVLPVPPSSAKHPSPALAAALSAADLDAATACFARDGCLLTADATTIRGREDIRAVLAQLISINATAEIEHGGMLVAGDVALAAECWTTRFARSDGATYTRRKPTTSVMRRVEGTWKLQIAAPWGWG